MKREAGFTLIEIIVTLLLVGIMAAVAGLGIVQGVRGYLFARDNSEISIKAQLAMSRLTRTFIEVLDISAVGASPTWVTYNRLSGETAITETLHVDGDAIRIASSANPSGGDILVDNVNSLNLVYRKGTDTWVHGTDDFQLLSSVEITLDLTRPDGGGTNTFTTVVSPRNNGNLGGEPVVTTPPPTSGCFVATAAFGDADHPVVMLLREFRDVILSQSSAGRMFIQAYYAGSPYLADIIRDRPLVSIMTQLLLLPLAGMAFLALNASLAFPLFILILLVAAAAHLSLAKRKTMISVRTSTFNQKGSVLLGLIVTMVIFSVLGAAVVSLTTGSTFTQLGSSSSTRAYYLAEGGMRYSASEFRNASGEVAKDDKLKELHTKVFTLGGDGTFRLDVFPWYFRTTADPAGNTSLQTEFPGGAPAGMSIPTNGFLKIGPETMPRQFTGRTVNGSNVTFTMATLPSYTVNSNVLPVGQAQATTLNRNGNLTLTSGSGFFPPINGSFTIGTATSTTGETSHVYVYQRRNGNILENVRYSQDQTHSFSESVPANAYITAMKFVEVQSTGTYGQGPILGAERTITYSIPIGWVSGDGPGEDVVFQEDFEDEAAFRAHWDTGLGNHNLGTVDGNQALKVTGTADFRAVDSLGTLLRVFRASLLTLRWSSTVANLHNSWSASGNLLSYDVQAKMRIQSDYYMPGIAFRVNAAPDHMYGVSYLRGRNGTTLISTDRDGIPDSLVPIDNQPMIVLWQEVDGERHWLAYKKLETTGGKDGVVDTNGRLVNWSTLLVRVIEADTLQFNTGSSEFRNGDVVTGSTSGATAVVKGTPILTSGGWATNNAAGWLTVTNVIKVSGAIQFESGENLQVNGVTRGRYTGISRQKDNYIRVYYGRPTNQNTANNNPLDNNRLGHARLTSSTQQVKWPVDNVSDWAAENDYFTLVQWDAATNPNVTGPSVITRLGTGNEVDAIIRTSRLVTPDSGTFTRSEVGLDTWGSSATSVAFDDFALRTAIPGQTQGFLPAIQR